MPTWGGILKELNLTAKPQENKPPEFDRVRRKYLTLLSDHTKRDVILYATKWTQGDANATPDVLSIVPEDIQGLMEVVNGLSNKSLDLILHSPGGVTTVVEPFVLYLRSKFDDIRVIEPQAAMSAATMISCASNRIVMGKHSFLGPIDPQMMLPTPLGQRLVPCQAILEQFEMAKKQCVGPANLTAWLPMLSQFGPDLLVQCANASSLSESLVGVFLRDYMFKGQPDAATKAAEIAKWLSSHSEFKSHGRFLPRAVLRDKGLIIDSLEDDSTLQDLVLSIFHTTTHTFSHTGAMKIIENQMGKAFCKSINVLQFIPGVHAENAPSLPPVKIPRVP